MTELAITGPTVLRQDTGEAGLVDTGSTAELSARFARLKRTHLPEVRS